MPKKEQDTDLSSLDRLAKELGFVEVEAPEDQAVVTSPGTDGKVDMIDAVERLYGIEHDKVDIVIKIRGGKIVSEEEVK
jgi:hypothetical protein